MLTTASTCSECAGDIPAEVFVRDDMVWMQKTCPLHGSQLVLIEKNPSVYRALRAQAVPVYPSHFIDVTDRCNLSCPYCYYPCRMSEDPSADDIIQQALKQPVPTYFHGGEPTLRADLPPIMAKLAGHKGTGLPTNGAGLLNEEYRKDVFRYIGRFGDNIAQVALSWHYGLNDNVIRSVFESVRGAGEKITGLVFTIKSKEDLREAIAVTQEYEDCTHETRIHVTTDIWDAKDTRQVFASDVLGWFRELADEQRTSFEARLNSGSLYWFPVMFGGFRYIIIRWYTKHDFDHHHMVRYPSYQAHNGETVRVLHGFIINDAMRRGWCRGIKMTGSH